MGQRPANLTQRYLAPHESVAYAHICSIKEERGRVGDGAFVWERRVGGWGDGGGGGWCGRWGGGLLSEAHNLIIQSIEQHIHFIVLQISPKLAGFIRSPQNRTELLYGSLLKKKG